MHLLKDMKTLQEISNEASRYNFKIFSDRLQQVEYLVDNTRTEMKLFQRLHIADSFLYYLAASDEITEFVVEVTFPYINSILTEIETTDFSVERCTELHILLQRVKNVLDEVYTYEKFWILDKKYIALLKLATACKYSLDKHLQHLSKRSVSQL